MFWLALLVLFIISIFAYIFIAIITMKTKPRSKHLSYTGFFVHPDGCGDGRLVNLIADEIESSVVCYDGWGDTICQPSEDDSVNRNHDGFVDNDSGVSSDDAIEINPFYEGSCFYYSIQSRLTHLSPHNEPDEPLELVIELKDSFGNSYSRKWSSCLSGAYFVAEPWIKSGNDYKPKYKKSHDEKDEVWCKTGGCGWWTLRYAALAMLRLNRGSAEGKLNYRDGYDNVTQSVRYEFRIIKISVSTKIEAVLCEQLIDALIEEDAHEQ